MSRGPGRDCNEVTENALQITNHITKTKKSGEKNEKMEGGEVRAGGSNGRFYRPDVVSKTRRTYDERGKKAFITKPQ